VSSAPQHWSWATGFDVVHGDHFDGFPELVRELGGDPGAMLRAVGLSPALLSDAKATLSYRVWASLLERAAADLAISDFGMRLAARQGGKVFGPIRGVMKNARTFGEAMAYFAGHAHVHSLAARVRLQPDPATRAVFVSHEVLVEELGAKRQLMEHIMLLGHLNAIESTGGRARVREVRFRHQPLSPPMTYFRYFHCDVRFDQHEDGVVYGERDLQSPIVNADAGAYERAVAYIEAQFPPVEPPLRAVVRGLVIQLLGAENCNSDAVAARLNMHARTLHRRLQAEQTSFQRIKDEVRREVALYFLEHTKFELAYIAHRLGYAEHSVFSRSCSRWFSASPSRVRTWRRAQSVGARSPGPPRAATLTTA
jgi:AraC-like DNA-binding protein